MMNHVCNGCAQPINDRFMLRTVGKHFHEGCLKCTRCQCRLNEIGSTLFEKQGMLLCAADYRRLFGKNGICAACNAGISSFEMVMRVKTNVYHLNCFSCSICDFRFCVGDKFFLADNKVVCSRDHSVFTSESKKGPSSPSDSRPIQRRRRSKPILTSAPRRAAQRPRAKKGQAQSQSPSLSDIPMLTYSCNNNFSQIPQHAG